MAVFFDQIVQGKAAMLQSFKSYFSTPSKQSFEVGISKVVGDAGVLHWVLDRGQPDASQGDVSSSSATAKSAFRRPPT